MRAGIVGASALVLVLAGCGSDRSGAGTVPTGTAVPSPAQQGSVCPPASLWREGSLPPAATGSMPVTGFEPVTVIECVVITTPVAGEGVWSVLREQRAQSGVGALAEAMRRPSDAVPADQACDAMAVLLPWFDFQDASGRVLRAAPPLDSCGKPQAAVLAALDALRFTTVSETRIAQVQTPAEAAAQAQADALGCPPDFKDMVRIVLSDPPGTHTWAGRVLSPSADPVVVCRYRTVGSDPEPLLHFESGERLDANDGAALVAKLESAPPPSPSEVSCSAIHTRVAGVFTASGWALVELDGCHRVLGEANALREATPTLLAALR